LPTQGENLDSSRKRKEGSSPKRCASMRSKEKKKNRTCWNRASGKKDKASASPDRRGRLVRGRKDNFGIHIHLRKGRHLVLHARLQRKKKGDWAAKSSRGEGRLTNRIFAQGREIWTKTTRSFSNWARERKKEAIRHGTPILGKKRGDLFSSNKRKRG